MILVPAGDPVDSVIKDLLPHLEKGDLLITLMLATATSRHRRALPQSDGERAFKHFGNGIREAYRSRREL
jgi:6-phosphogluconate dehydrogenase